MRRIEDNNHILSPGSSVIGKLPNGEFMNGDKCTPFRSADIINCIVDDKLKVLVQQGIDQRAVGNALPICQSKR